MKAILTKLAGLTGLLGPKAKAVAAGLLPLATAIGNWAISGHFNAASIEAAALGAVASVVVYFVPNKAKAPVAKP